MMERFWAGAIRVESGCLEWQRSLGHNGYGLGRWVTPEGIVYRAHRMAWILTYGPIPDGLHVLHRCDNRKCIEPTDLFLGTNADNKADFAAKGRGKGQRRPWQEGDAHWTHRIPERLHRGPKDPNRERCKRGHDITVAANRITRSEAGAFVCRMCAYDANRKSRQAKEMQSCRQS